MSMKTARFLPIAIALAEPGADGKIPAPKEVQIIRCGMFNHPWFGPFKIDEEVLGSFVQNFKDNIRGVDLALDYQHNNQDVAAAWFKDIYTKGSGKKQELWAEIDWTPKGREAVESKEFRYLSAEFDLDYQDVESLDKRGPTLFGAGLTNRPFVKGMAPTVELKEGEEINMKTLAELQADVDAANKKLTEQADEIKALKEKSAKDGQDAASLKLAEENKALKAQIQTNEAEKAKEAKTVQFNEMLKKGTACEAQREAFMSGDFAKFTELAVPMKLNEGGHAKDDETRVTISTVADAEAEIDKLAEKLLSEKKAQTYSQAVAQVLRENPKLSEMRNQHRKTA